MIIGIDFDNTIVRYDELFYAIALEQGLIPRNLEVSKVSIRNHLRTIGAENEWTRIQGLAYTTRILEATPFPGVKEFLEECQIRAIEVYIVSHKTKNPIIGGSEDLHDWANKWIDQNGIRSLVKGVYFELTIEKKAQRVRDLRCDYFIDDLPEFLKLITCRKILFGAAKEKDLEGGAQVSSWSEITTHTIMHGLCRNLLTEHGFLQDFVLQKIEGGRNNRVYIVDGSTNFLIKAYNLSRYDTRDRLGAEYSFLKFLEEAKIAEAPRALARDDKQRIGLYSYIEGEKIKFASDDLIGQALDFIIRLWKSRHLAKLPLAVDACLSITDHVELAKIRIARLESLNNDLLAPLLNNLRNDLACATVELIEMSRASRVDPSQQIPASDMIPSPSDFGLHNALVQDGKAYFLDFEYAGLDDPAKLTCDFFSQPDIPIPDSWLEQFKKSLLPTVSSEKLQLLLLIHRIKWCCIMLNSFLPSENNRRIFAGSREDLTYQLIKAQTYYESRVKKRPFHNI